MKSNYSRLGEYINEVNNRNTNLTVSKLIGVSMEKTFISSVANTVGTDMSVYKILKKGQFACKLMSVGRDQKLPVDLYKEDEDAIVSSAYFVFESIDKNIVLPDYLLMWLCRPENDRHIGYISGGDVRGGISWETFCNTPIRVPSIAKQKEIVAEYNTVQNCIDLNKQLIQKLEETAQTIYKNWFVDFEFPDENGKPYKNSGGEMVESELGEIPKGWEVKSLGDVATITAGGDKPNIFSPKNNNNCIIPIYSNTTENEGLFGYTNKPTVCKKSVTISARGAIIGFTVLRTIPFVPIVRLIVVTPNNDNLLNYVFHTIQQFNYDGSGSAQGQLTIPNVSTFKVISPQNEILKKYQKIDEVITNNIEIEKKQTKKLKELQSLLLSKLATIKY